MFPTKRKEKIREEKRKQDNIREEKRREEKRREQIILIIIRNLIILGTINFSNFAVARTNVRHDFQVRIALYSMHQGSNLATDNV